jgi:hypothetical protein
MKKFLPFLFLYLAAFSIFAFFNYEGRGQVDSEDNEEGMQSDSMEASQVSEIPFFESGETLLGSWNLRLKPPPAFMRPGDYHDPLLIAQIIIESGADLWALQELFDDYKDAAGALRNEYMDVVVLVLNRRTQQQWSYWVGDAEDSWGQNSGFLWNADKVEALQTPSVLNDSERQKFALTDRRLWSRRPSIGVFRYKSSGTRLLLVSAHHKGYNSDEAQAHREAEAILLVEQLSEFKETLAIDGVVLLGRFADEYEEACTAVYSEAGYRDLNPIDVPNLMSSSQELVWSSTRILVDGLGADLFPDTQVATLGGAWLTEREIDLKNFIYYVSNYLPLVTRVR